MQDEDDNNEIRSKQTNGERYQLSEREISYLKAAGIDPNMLSSSDKAAIIQALLADSTLIDDPDAGSITAILMNLGLLQDMIDGKKRREEWEEIEEEKKEKEKEQLETDNLLLLNRQLQMQRLQEAAQKRDDLEFSEYTNVTSVTDYALPFLEALNAAPNLNISMASPATEISSIPLATIAEEMLATPTPIANPLLDAINLNSLNLGDIDILLSQGGDDNIKPIKTPTREIPEEDISFARRV